LLTTIGKRCVQKPRESVEEPRDGGAGSSSVIAEGNRGRAVA